MKNELRLLTVSHPNDDDKLYELPFSSLSPKIQIGMIIIEDGELKFQPAMHPHHSFVGDINFEVKYLTEKENSKRTKMDKESIVKNIKEINDRRAKIINNIYLYGIFIFSPEKWEDFEEAINELVDENKIQRLSETKKIEDLKINRKYLYIQT